MRRIIFSEDFNSFAGTGFDAEPIAGQLDADNWAVGTFNSPENDEARGVTTGGVGTGGVYAIDRGDGERGLLIQPGGSDFTPGALTLSLNSGDTAVTDVTVSFERLVNNDQPRANSFDLEYSIDGGATFVSLDSFTSDEASDNLGVRSALVQVKLPDLAANTDVILRWSGDDVSGAGARDEFGIDNLVIDGVADTAPATPIVINKVLASTTGTDSEFIELFGAAGASLAGLSFIGVESDDQADNGTIDFRFDFADDAVLGDNGFLLLANQTAEATYGVTANITIADALENSSTTFALVETASITGPSVTGDESVIDAVGSSDGDYTDPGLGAPVVGPDGNFLPAGVGRVADGVDTDTAADFRILSFGNDPSTNQPTAGTGLGGDTGGGGDVTIDDEATLISAVQGDGAESALVGQTVVIEAIVTADFQTGDGDDDVRSLGGFFVMEEIEDQDGNAATSEGLFIDEFGLDNLTDVNQGDKVRILGTVSERFGKTRIEVQEIRIEEANAVDPMSLAVTTSLPTGTAREALENMLVTFDEALTFSESFNYEDFGALTLTSGGPAYQFSQLNTPDVAGNAAHQAEFEDRSILLEDGISGRRGDLDPIREPDGELIGFESGLRMGQSVSDLTAIVDFDFGDYRLRLPEDLFFTLDETTNPVEEAPQDVGSAFKVASLNVLNYFTTIEGLTDNGNNPRGADDLEELARQTDKLVATLSGMDADVIGLIEIENDFAGDTFAVSVLVDALNDAEGAEIWSFVDPGQEFVGDDAIAVAFIYNQTTTDLVGNAAILDTDEFLDPLGDLTTNGDAFNRAALAQSFQEKASGGIFTASVNHFKSKGSATGAAADEDAGDGAGRGNATRTEAARILSEWLDSDPTNSGDDDTLILGDLNSYARETPITTLEDAGFTDLARAFEGDDVYSYRFSGQIGTLDYALANEALLEQVTGATTWNVNSDTPVFFDYNTDATFGSDTLRPTDQGLFNGESPLRASDHDPVIVGLNLDDDTIVEPLIIMGTTGRDRLNGTDADEIIIAGGNIDLVRGGGGADTFVFTDRDGQRDSLRIADFNIDEDILDLGGAEIASVGSSRNTLRISLDEDRDTIILTGVSDIEDITFASDLFMLG